MGILYDERVRWTAVLAMCHEDQNVRKAEEWFRARCAQYGYEVPSDLPDFLHRWWAHFEAHGNVHDEPGRGTKSHVDPALVDAAAEHFSWGYLSEMGVHRNWTSFEIAYEHDEAIKQLVEASGVTPRTFFAHVRQVRWGPASGLAVPSCCTRLHATVNNSATSAQRSP